MDIRKESLVNLMKTKSLDPNQLDENGQTALMKSLEYIAEGGDWNAEKEDYTFGGEPIDGWPILGKLIDISDPSTKDSYGRNAYDYIEEVKDVQPNIWEYFVKKHGDQTAVGDNPSEATPTRKLFLSKPRPGGKRSPTKKRVHRTSRKSTKKSRKTRRPKKQY